MNHLDQTKLVITGMGAVTPIGVGVPAYWQALTAGTCGIGPIIRFDVSDYKVKLAAEVKDFDISQYVEGREAKRMDKSSHFAIPELIPNIVASHLSMRFGFQGENYCPVSACATANHAIGEAMRAIRHGYQDIVLCGGTENGIIPFSLAGFQNMKALHTGDDPTAASIPFDARRSGFVMGEGAGTRCDHLCRGCRLRRVGRRGSGCHSGRDRGCRTDAGGCRLHQRAWHVHAAQ